MKKTNVYLGRLLALQTGAGSNRNTSLDEAPKSLALKHLNICFPEAIGSHCTYLLETFASQKIKNDAFED